MVVWVSLRVKYTGQRIGFKVYQETMSRRISLGIRARGPGTEVRNHMKAGNVRTGTEVIERGLSVSLEWNTPLKPLPTWMPLIAPVTSSTG